MIGCIGTNVYGNRKIAFVRENKEELSKTFWEIFLLRVIMIFISLIFFYIITYQFDNKYYIYYLAQSLTIVATIFDISWFFMGLEKFDVTVVRNFIVKIIALICIFLFVKSINDLFVYILILSLSILFGNLTMFPSLKGIIYFPNITNINIKRHLKPSFILFIPEVATQVYLVLNKTMLGVIVSVQASGFYEQSDKIIKMVLAIVTATGTVMLPYVASAFAKGKTKKIKGYLYDSFSMVNTISVAIFFGLISIAHKLVPLFFSNKFISVTPLLSIEAIVIIMISWSNVIGVQYLLPTKQTKKYTYSVIVGALLNIFLNIPLIIMFSTLGAVIATVISEISVTCYQLISIKNQVSIRRLFRGTYKPFIGGTIMMFLILIIDDLMATTWISLVLEVLFGIIIYATVMILLKTDFIKIIKKIKNEY